MDDKDMIFEDEDTTPDPLDDGYDVFGGTQTKGSVIRDPVIQEGPGPYEEEAEIRRRVEEVTSQHSEAEAQVEEAKKNLYDDNLYNGPEVLKKNLELLTSKPRDHVIVVEEDDSPIPSNLPVIYEGLSARFEPGTSAQAQVRAIKVWVQAHEITPVYLGDMFNQLHKEHGVSYEDIATQVGLKVGYVKNYASWCNRVKPESRREGMSVTILQEAASIRNIEEQLDFIERAVEGDYSKKQLRAMKEGQDPEDYDDDEQEVEKVKCPTCGTKVRAELLG